MQRISCQNCDAKNSVTAKYCSGCGFELEMPLEEKEVKKENLNKGEASGRFKKAGSVVAGIVAFIIAYLGVQYLFFDRASFDKVLVEVSNQINENCPLMLDKDTRLDGTVALPDNTLKYNYTLVNLSQSEIDPTDLKSYLEPKIVNNVKTSPDMKYFRDNRVTLLYAYYDKNGSFVLNLEVSPENYK